MDGRLDGQPPLRARVGQEPVEQAARDVDVVVLREAEVAERGAEEAAAAVAPKLVATEWVLWRSDPSLPKPSAKDRANAATVFFSWWAFRNTDWAAQWRSLKGANYLLLPLYLLTLVGIHLCRTLR